MVNVPTGKTASLHLPSFPRGELGSLVTHRAGFLGITMIIIGS